MQKNIALRLQHRKSALVISSASVSEQQWFGPAFAINIFGKVQLLQIEHQQRAPLSICTTIERLI
jgi:hypothetical protein